MKNQLAVKERKEMLASSLSPELGTAYAELRQQLRGFLRRHVSDASVAEDLLQDIFVKALQTHRSGKSIANVSAWLYTAARTTIIDHYRAHKDVHIELDESHWVSEEDELELHSKLALCLRPFAEQLAPIYRDSLLASELDGIALRELAEREGVSLSAIKSRVSRARSMLKEKVIQCCHVEMQDGLVTDYYRHSVRKCGKAC